MKHFILLNMIFFIGFALGQAQNNQLRVVAIGAHPDDCTIKMGGTAALLAQKGYAVKFVSVTNGDKGHQNMGGGPLAKRRYKETQEAARRLGIDKYVVLNNHDGELTPNLAVRKQLIREIREWNADVVIAPRPNDYHPDHRYTGVLVQDAAYMVIVPDVLPQVPALQKNPVFLYFQDGFQRPNPFTPDITIDITQTFDKKVDAMDAYVSQVYEWLPWTNHNLDQVPEGKTERKEWLRNSMEERANISPAMRKSLAKWYGEDRADDVKYAESFEICEYGRQPTEDEIRQLISDIR